MVDKTTKTEEAKNLSNTSKDEETKLPADTAPTETSSAKKTETKKESEDIVEVSAKVLQSVVEKQTQMEESIEKLTKENERLMAVADKSRLAHYDQKSAKGLINTFRVGLWTDYEDKDKAGVAKEKMVVGWRTVQDSVQFVNGVLKEEQIVELFLDEGEGEKPSSKKMPLVNRTRMLTKYIIGEVIKESVTDGGVTKTLRFPNGRELEFDIVFLNP